MQPLDYIFEFIIITIIIYYVLYLWNTYYRINRNVRMDENSLTMTYSILIRNFR